MTYAWSVDGTTLPGTDASVDWAAGPGPARTSRLKVTVSDPHGVSASHEWVIQVRGDRLVGPVAYWSLDEATGTRMDASVYTNHLSDNASVGMSTGQVNNAAELNGANYLSIDDNAQQMLDAGDALTVTWAGPGSNGGTAVNADRVVYTPTGTFEGQDAFPYALSDGRGGSATGTVQVLVVGAAAMELDSDGDAMELRFNSVTGYQYMVEYRDSLVGSNGWRELSGAVVVESDGVDEVTDPASASVTRRFYRIKIRP